LDKFIGAHTGEQLPYPYPSGMWSSGQPNNYGGDKKSFVNENAVHLNTVIILNI
jgi:hypothetical protein